MKLLVMSDTHGDEKVIKRVKDFHKDVDAVIHCGDSELPFDHPYLSEVQKVRGNCDKDQRFPNELHFKLEGKTVLITHGHLFHIKSTMMNLYYRAKELQADVVFFGHSHVLGMEKVDDILFVNPGSLRKPRGIKEKSYVIVEYKENKWLVTAYTDEHQELTTKQFEIE